MCRRLRSLLAQPVPASGRRAGRRRGGGRDAAAPRRHGRAPPPVAPPHHREPVMTQPQWQPANETERALAQALADGDQRRFFGVIATADLYLPQAGDDAGEEQTFITGELFGQTVLPVYTSLESLVAAVS